MDRHIRTAVAGRMVMTAMAALAVTAVLAACGPQGPGSQPPPSGAATSATTPDAVAAPADLLEQAVRNTIDAPSKRLVGSAAVSAGAQEFDIIYIGENARGTQTSRAMGLVSVVEFVRFGDDLYILASEAYWQNYVRLEELAQVSGKWVRVAADNPNHETLLVPTDAGGFAEAVGEVAEAGNDRVDGTPAIVIEDADGNRFYVSADGTPYLLRVEATKATEVGEVSIELAYSQFGTVTETIAAPTGEIVDLR